MSVIDLDKRIKQDNTATVKLAGNDFKITFNDTFRAKVTELGANVSKLMQKLDSDDFNDELLDMSENDRKQEIQKVVKEINHTIVAGLDDLLGKGAGKLIDDHYGHSSDADSYVIQVLTDAADDAVQVKENKNRAQRRARYRTER